MSFKVVPSHHWEVGSTTVGGVRGNSSLGTWWSPEQWEDTLEATLMPGSRIMRTYQDVLYSTITFRKATVRRTLGVVCAVRVLFSLIFVLFMLLVFYAWFYYGHSFLHALLTVKIFAGKVNLKLLQMARVHIAKIKPDPIWQKSKELKKIKCGILIYKALGEIHKYKE